MSKRIFKIVLLFSIIALFISTICFATNENVESTNLGHEITSSIKETEKSVDNLTQRNADANVEDDAKDMGNTVKDVARSVENTVEDGARSVENTVEDGVEKAENVIENGAEAVENTTNNATRDMENGVDDTRNAISGETSNFTSGETNDNTNNGMSTRTWVWIIIAVIAVIIIAAVWYYASNKND